MDRIKRLADSPAGAAGIAAFLCGGMTHMYALVNMLHNYDDIFKQPFHYGSGVPSGRFALEWLADLSVLLGSGYDLPWVNGVLFLALISLAAGFLASALSIGRKRHAALIGMLLAVFPTATSILIHRFTAVYYGISILLAVLAVWVLPKGRWGLPCSAVCIALSMGIYQAYVPITVSIFVLQLLRQTLGGGTERPLAIVRRGAWDCAALLLGLGLYYAVLKLALSFTGEELLAYQGIEQMGQVSLTALPGLIRDAIYLVCMLPVKNYCGINGTAFLKAVYLVLGAVSVILIACILLLRRPKLPMVLLTGALGVAFLAAVNFIYIMCPDSHIYTLMVYAAALIGCAPVVILECLPPLRERPQRLARGVVALGVALLIAGYAYEDNVNYTALYYCNRQVENYMNALVVQVRMTEGFDTDKEWAFIGEIDDPLMWFSWSSGLTCGGNAAPEDLLNCHSTMAWINQYFGYAPPVASEERIQALSQTEAVRAMPVWPNAGSIQVIGDTVVIKCG